MSARQSVIPGVVADAIAHPTTDCVIAPKTANGCGYVQFWLNGTPNLLAHRYAYEQAHGPIPPGYQVDHLCHDKQCAETKACRHRACINPAHLKATTPRENVLRGNTIVAKFAAATHCKNGHPFDEANTYTYTTARGGAGRGCRICRSAASRAHKQRNAS